MRLPNRTALVTGGSSGIGRAIAIRLASEGAHVTIADIRRRPDWAPDGGGPTDEVIRRAHGAAAFVQADVTGADDVERAIEEAAAPSGRLDIVVSNAGVFGSSSAVDTTEEEWDSYMAVNLKSQFLVCRSAVRRMLRQEPRDGVRGRVVNISSQLAFTAPPGRCAYAVSKAGIAQLTRQLAVDYAREGIIVNAVAPGRIITGTFAGERDYLERGLVDPGIAFSLSRTPFPRLGRPEDVAGAVLFLASDDCTFISGHNLLVDGGWTAY
ncbi:MAG TPA: SDR family NAD(P)-dependent oxidoreductase [Acidimicrobiales bacterium]|nr:SDR family NAD(P)-dependent oxidoreductase [Acidimicrobiales bacterium]